MFTFRSGDPVALVVDQPAHLGEVAVPLDQPVQHGGLAEEGVLTYTANLESSGNQCQYIISELQDIQICEFDLIYIGFSSRVDQSAVTVK